MTERDTPTYTATLVTSGADDPLGAASGRTPMPGASASGPETSSTQVAKDQASTVAQNTAEAGQHVAEVAKDQVAAVAAEAGSQAKDLVEQLRTELAAQAGQQQQRVADGLRLLSEELHSMANHDGQSGVATDVAHQGARRSQDIAAWLDQREPGQLVQEVTAFSRRKPGLFLLLAAGAGLAAGRLTRGVKDASGEHDGSGASHMPSSSFAAPLPSSSFAAPRAGLLGEDAGAVRPFASSQDDGLGFVPGGGLG